MCDYSLQHMATRAAKVGDLITTKFNNSITRGFAEVGEPNCGPSGEVQGNRGDQRRGVGADLQS